MDFIEETFNHWRKTPFKWGVEDCLLSIGRYAALCGHKDVSADFEGTYTTEDEALVLVKDNGGFRSLIDRIGLSETDEPKRGDIVLINTSFGPVGAICTGDGVAARMPHGMLEFNLRFARIIKAWSV